MERMNAIEAWQERDDNFAERFALATSLGIRHSIGRLFGKNKHPDLNHYRDHLLAGNAIGALPVNGSTVHPQYLEELAASNFDHLMKRGATAGSRAIAKISMELSSGKYALPIPRISPEEEAA